MVWGMVMPTGLIAVKIIEGRLNADAYIKMINEYALNLMRLNCEEILMVQDNARPHIAKKTLEYFKEVNINLVDWPARSPDLNIMETVWSMLVQDVYLGRQPQNVRELKEKMFDAVNRVNFERRHTIKSLYDTFTKRIVSVLLKKGDLFN